MKGRFIAGRFYREHYSGGMDQEIIHFRGICDICGAPISLDFGWHEGMIDYLVQDDGKLITWIRHYAAAPPDANPDCAIYSSRVYEVSRSSTADEISGE